VQARRWRGVLQHGDGKWDFVTIEYTLFKTIVALSSDHRVTHIPAGAVVKAPATFSKKGMVEVIYKGHIMKMFALDLMDGGRIDSGHRD
jgi:hypothetical protein